MNYADQLPIIAAQYRAELSSLERERMANRNKAHGVACEENRRIMLAEFFERIRAKEAARA